MPESVVEHDLAVEDAETENESVTVDYNIASYPSDFTLAGIADMWKDGDIVVPDYQRRFVWSIHQSSLLIDSFLSGLPVPPVFFYVGDDNKNIVVDGQQRILSIAFYFEGYFGQESVHGKRQVFRLMGLDSKNPYANRTFDDLDDSAQRKLKRAVLRAINIRQLDPAGESTSSYHIFERLNTGGTPLKPQEIRNCVFRGAFNDQLKEANEDRNWRKILGNPYNDRYQKDIELLLRVFALTDSVERYEKPMKEFLNTAMKEHKRGHTRKTENFFDAFPRVTQLVSERLGEKPFHLRGPLNGSALDSVLCVLIENDRRFEGVHLADAYAGLQQDDEFMQYTRINTTDTKTVKDRVSIVRRYLLG